jgi:hypothetical protein
MQIMLNKKKKKKTPASSTALKRNCFSEMSIIAEAKHEIN